MNVLQLCHKPSQPAKDGGCLAIHTISQGLLSTGISLKILTLSTHKHVFKRENFTENFVNTTQIESVFADTKLNIVDAFSNLVTADSYNVSRFFSTDFDALLRETLEENQFDVIHLESLFMTTYCHTIRRFSKAKIVLRSHNLEHMIWERMATQSTHPAKRIYLKLLAKQLKKYEIGIFDTLDGIAAITNEDEENYKNLGFNCPLSIIPFGIHLKDYHFSPSSSDTTTSSGIDFFHLGSMDWKPNIEGVSWFLEKVWPDLRKLDNSFELNLAGRNMPDWLSEQIPSGVYNTGEVPDAKKFMAENDCMVVPLLSAGGMRIKIIEGMALGNVVISTTIGAEGITYTNRKDILIADSPEDFVAQVKWLMEVPSRKLNIIKNARKLVEKKYNNDLIIEALLSFYKSVMNS